MARQSILLAPDQVMGYVQAGMALQAVGEDSAALAQYQRARGLEPRHPVPLLGRGWLSLAAGDRAGARRAVDTLLALAPGFPPGLELSMCVDMADGEFASALRAYEAWGSPTSSRGGFMLGVAGRKRESQRLLEEVVARGERFVSSGDEGPTPLFEAASALVLLGKREEALGYFRKALDAGWRDARWARQDPLLSVLRNDAAFLSILEEADRQVGLERRAIREGSDGAGGRLF
jgi:tetratricopeptide (TPR) repeat protein